MVYVILFCAVPQPMDVESNLLASQAPPDLLLGSEDGEKKSSPGSAVTDTPVVGTSTPTPTTTEGNGETEKENDSSGAIKDEKSAIDEEAGIKAQPTGADEAKPSSVDDAKTETMETNTVETEASSDSGEKSSDSSSAAQQTPDKAISTTDQLDGNGNSLSQASSEKQEEITSKENDNDNDENPSEKEVKSEVSDSAEPGLVPEKKAGDSESQSEHVGDEEKEAEKETVEQQKVCLRATCYILLYNYQ